VEVVTMTHEYDAVVIGGGAAGLNGALMLARSRRSVLVLDAGEPRNAPAQAVHGLLARDGMPPAELLERGRDEVRRYGGQVEPAEVPAARAVEDRTDGPGFEVDLTDGRTIGARRLLLATGLTDELPDVAGLRDRWGRDVVHCPYCHGWEVRDRAIGVLATSPMAIHHALLFHQLSADVTLFTHTAPPPSAEDAERLAALGIPLVDGPVAGLEITDDRITGVRLADGTVVAREVVAVAPRMVARAAFLTTLGLATEENPMGVYVPTDPAGRTAVPGVWAAGNITDLSAQVGAAASAGALAGAQINADLAMEDARRAVASRAEASEAGLPA